MKKKLTELITSRRDPCDIGACPFTVDDVRPCSLCETESLADHLIANGVTFADVPETNVGKWIPTSERLPTLDDAAVGSVWAILKGERPDMWSYISVRMHPEDFVCWMSIPKPPKEGE